MTVAVTKVMVCLKILRLFEPSDELSGSILGISRRLLYRFRFIHIALIFSLVRCRSKIQELVDKAEDNVYETFELDLSDLKAPHISSRVYDLHELKTLNISKNRLGRINPNIQYLDK